MGMILDLMNRDHDELNQLFDSFTFDMSDYEGTRSRFMEILYRVFQHMLYEEQVIFPRFGMYTGLNKRTGVYARTLREHMIIRKLAEDIEKAFETRDMKKITLRIAHFQRALIAHEAREHATMYPVSDKILR